MWLWLDLLCWWIPSGLCVGFCVDLHLCVSVWWMGDGEMGSVCGWYTGLRCGSAINIRVVGGSSCVGVGQVFKKEMRARDSCSGGWAYSSVPLSLVEFKMSSNRRTTCWSSLAGFLDSICDKASLCCFFDEGIGLGVRSCFKVSLGMLCPAGCVYVVWGQF